jgi:hypothetical protein
MLLRGRLSADALSNSARTAIRLSALSIAEKDDFADLVDELSRQAGTIVRFDQSVQALMSYISNSHDGNIASDRFL